MAMQRRARGEPESGPSDDSEAQRRNRVIASNLAGTGYRGTGFDQGAGGGIFRIKRISSDDAEFWFAGFNKDMGRKTQQLIEVSKGEAGDIYVAIVRRMIAIIRSEVTGDFRWRSDRLGRDIWLSARPEDDQALQQTLMREMFPDWSASMRH